jgi:hypothetical protein
MRDTLERERLVDNLIDRLFRAEERIARLEELIMQQAQTDVIVPEPATGGRWLLYVKDMGGEIGPVLAMKEL